jgi:GT2 family glycosyltransferase
MTTCLASLSRQMLTADLEVLLVDNQSHPDNRRQVELLTRQLLPESVDVIHLSYDAPFNHSAQSNLAAEHSTGEVLVMVNNDAAFISPNTLQTLADWALTPNIASAGPQVIGKHNRLVAAGIEVYPGDAALDLPGGIRESTVKPLANTIHYTVGNGFACAAIAREVWFKLGGLDAEAYPTQYNDVDYCLRALDLGLNHLYLGDLTIYHQPGQSEYRTREQVEQIHATIRARYPHFHQYESINPVLVQLKGNILDPVLNPTVNLYLF